MFAAPAPMPYSSTAASGHFVVRLVGDADAVGWVTTNLRGPGFGVEPLPFDSAPGLSELPGPIVWVARPGEPEPGRTIVDDAAVWSFPCLVVIPPGGAPPDIIAGHPSVESFEVVREPEDAPVLRMRLERLLLLHRRRAQTEAILHDLPVIVYTRTLDGVVTSLNAEAETFVGRSRADVVGRSLSEILPDGLFAQMSVAEMNEGLLARGRHRVRIVAVTHQGRRSALDARALLLRDGHGIPWGAQVVMSDLTDEEETQERLRVEADRNEILATIATATRDVTDLGRVVDSALSIVGLRSGARTTALFLPDDARSAFALRHSWRSTPEIPSPVGAAWLTRETDVFRAVDAAREPFVVRDATTGSGSVESEALRRLGASSGIVLPVVVDGEVVACLGLTFTAPRPFPPDEVRFLVLVADQLALAVRAARLYQSLAEKLRALAEEQRLRERADDDRQRLLSMLVHDLKNPLAAVLASLELSLERIAGDDRLERLLRTSMASARSLAGMIDDALLVYRTGDTPASLRAEDVDSVLAQPFEEARWMAAARQVDLSIDLPDALPSVSLDASRYRRAVANILSNALKFSRRGGDVRVSVDVEEDGGSSWLVLRVADSGPGFPESVKDRIGSAYERFAGSERIPGTGLGLTVVAAVAAAHGGQMRVEPRARPAGGSVFSLRIPA
ncbi:MAG: sensor histidine kinase [Thermoanaerobaculia bacterium]